MPGMVVTVDRGRYGVRLDSGGDVTGVKARELGRGALVVGDGVDLVGDTTGEPGTLARIVRRHERRTVLRRTADDTDPAERVIVANADALAVVTALADPEPNERMIDRCLVAALDGGLTTVLVLTKSDLGSPDTLIADYSPLDVPVLATSRDDQGTIETLREQLTGRITVLVGHSGVGKSTLVNALVPDADRATGHVNAVTGRGRHTSTSAVALELPGGGWIVDTPGIRSFGLAHVDDARVIEAFPDVAEAAERLCPRGCSHLSAESGCELDEWASTPAQEARVDSIRRVLRSRAGGD